MQSRWIAPQRQDRAGWFAMPIKSLRCGAFDEPESRRRTGGAATLLELLAAATWTVVVAADFWRQARLDGNSRIVAQTAQQPIDVRRIFGFVLLNAHDHLPIMLVTQGNDGFPLFNGAYADHGGSFVSSQLWQFPSLPCDLLHEKTRISLPSFYRLAAGIRAIAPQGTPEG